MNNNVLVLVDIQKEYNTLGRPYYIKGIEASLEQAKQVLTYARQNKWNIIHVKHLKAGEIFAPGSEFSEYIPGFIPMNSEKEFIKDNFSCFSNEAFSREMEQYKAAKIYVAGYNSTMCILSTIICGYHQGYDIHYIYDASNAKSDGKTAEQVRHSMMTSVLTSFSTLISARNLIAGKVQ